MRIGKKMLAALSGAVVAGTALTAIGSTGVGPASADPGHNAKPTVTVAGGGLDPIARSAFGPGTGRLVVDWNKELVTLEQTPGAQPSTIHPTRSYALLQTAIYDAVVSITHADAPYLFSVVAPRNARPDAAADQAAHDTLAALFPSFAAQLNQMLGAELAAIPDGPAKDAGLVVGGRTATIVLALRAGDGSAVTAPPFVAGTQPGDYQLTPPNLAAAAFTNWGGVTPWVLDSGDQFRPPPPPALTSPQWAAAINEVQSLGEDISTTRTADETTRRDRRTRNDALRLAPHRPGLLRDARGARRGGSSQLHAPQATSRPTCPTQPESTAGAVRTTTVGPPRSV